MYEERSEERRQAAIRSIEEKGVKVVENEMEPTHHRVLENVDAGLEESIKCGAALPKRILIDSSHAEALENVRSNPATYSNKKDSITINPRSMFFQAGMMRSKARAERLRDIRRFSTDSIMHTIRHELSHCAHWHHDQTSYLLNDFDKLSEKELAIVEVSNYAGENPPEFIAEVRAAFLDGKEFSDDIMEMYDHYSGGLKR
ncbi:Wss1p-related putative metallopeptidase [Methanomassiliicoccus luminyensis]|uniref:Wss1p-related putative metallopeptidase n=1 Tax=Methanomassiliicoccus luminyensis TaxID=1080712 RepID=UPI001F2EA666|nr:Wss1p-related putative metallopeptidase [Methanomassiliicoccus luminyensis]